MSEFAAAEPAASACGSATAAVPAVTTAAAATRILPLLNFLCRERISLTSG